VLIAFFISVMYCTHWQINDDDDDDDVKHNANSVIIKNLRCGGIVAQFLESMAEFYHSIVNDVTKPQ